MVTRILTLILLLCSATVSASGLSASPTGLSASSSGLFGGTSTQPRFLPADQAFAFDARQQGQHLLLTWQISPGYYLYRQQIEITAEHASLAPITLPAGLPHHDEFFGNTEIYRDQLSLPVTLNSAQNNAIVSVTYQGCAAAGFCYPPQTKQISVSAVAPPASGATSTSTPAPTQQQANSATSASSASGTPASTATDSTRSATSTSTSDTPGQLPFNPLWALLIGIGIAFTPCVLPMYPLISGIVLGGKQRLSTARALWLAFVYVQGMALTYTALGIVVALAGLQFQAAFQSPWVLISLSVIFSLLALSMFGLFTLQLPSSLQTRLTAMSSRQQGGATWGVFSMGAIGGLICSPCTTAPLSAILLYIAQSGNLWQGGGTLYLYALGMGLPLIVVTVFGNRLLPKSGPWMQHVKTGFGFIILALPVFLLERLLDTQTSQLLWALLGVAFFAWAFIVSLQAQRHWMRIIQICCLAAALIAVRPVQDWLFGASSVAAAADSHQLPFNQIHNTQQLSQALADAKGKPVMLDLYADWCVACKEFEKYTFSDARVQQALEHTVLLQIDMTRNSPENTALLNKLNVLGLPTILFFNDNGNELTQQRVTGFMDASQFLSHIENTDAS